MRSPALLAALALAGTALAARLHSAELGLRPSFGGAVLEGRITAASADELTGVWSAGPGGEGGGRARLLRCSPRCETVKAIPLQGTLVLNENTPYRVVLGGTFRPGARVRLALRFQDVQVLNVSATVSRR